jgi:glycosyltransferase involved in cell wall biosynthesis
VSELEHERAVKWTVTLSKKGDAAVTCAVDASSACAGGRLSLPQQRATTVIGMVVHAHQLRFDVSVRDGFFHWQLHSVQIQLQSIVAGQSATGDVERQQQFERLRATAAGSTVGEQATSASVRETQSIPVAATSLLGSTASVTAAAVAAAAPSSSVMSIVDRAQLHAGIVHWVQAYEREHQLKINLCGLSCLDSPVANSEELAQPDPYSCQLAELLWLECDTLVSIFPRSSLREGSSSSRACSTARKARSLMHDPPFPGVVDILMLSRRHEVLVDADGRIPIITLPSYQMSAPTLWAEIAEHAAFLQQRGLRVVFCSSTPQGGGVALMRHALLRLFRLLGVSARWIVTRPSPAVFDMTKHKFHNVLQGVAPADTHLTELEKDMWQRWCQQNVENYWQPNDKHLQRNVYDDGRGTLIVIDDPQPSGMIPELRRLYPAAKFVYRCHTQLATELINDPATEQWRVWQYLYSNFISLVDLFVCHPIDAMVPAGVTLPCAIMPATTDVQDGLTKTLSPSALAYYQQMFNQISASQTGKQLCFSRSYFAQVARFDPSKGIFDLLQAYFDFRHQRAERRVNVGVGGPDAETAPLTTASFADPTLAGALVAAAAAEDTADTSVPQLVLTGHGSVDDPEGSGMYRATLELLEQLGSRSEADKRYAADVIVANMPACDQLLNAVLSGARVVFQCSRREGFEIKCTEALRKTRPVVAYLSGGLE